MALGIIKLLVAVGHRLVRRGHGLFKILFVIDDFLRIFTMTILTIAFFSWLNLPQILIILGAVLGLVIDMHDFISENEIAKFF